MSIQEISISIAIVMYKKIIQYRNIKLIIINNLKNLVMIIIILYHNR
jgi:hypothetical protein